MDLRDIKEFFKDTFKYIIVMIVVLFLAIYIISLQQIVGPSMNNTLKDNDIVLLDRITYKLLSIKRGDIISLSYADTKYLIKRVIGLPGDSIEFVDNKLYINNELVEETYLSPGVITHDFSLNELGYDKIPENMYLVLGDNRADSMDSRDKKVGLINKKDIIGKVRLKIWPLNEFKLIK